MSNFNIKILSESDWATYKRLRLTSLKDSPDAFGSTYERESLFTDALWKSRLNLADGNPDALPLIASTQNSALGLAWGRVHENTPRVANIYQMWVSPNARGQGVGRALLSRIVMWAEELELDAVHLSVTSTNLSAVSLYQNFGFETYGNSEPLRKDSELEALSMMLKLNA